MTWTQGPVGLQTLSAGQHGADSSQSASTQCTVYCFRTDQPTMEMVGGETPRTTQPCEGWADLPEELWQSVLSHLLSVDCLHSVACSAQHISRLSQVNRSTGRAPSHALANGLLLLIHACSQVCKASRRLTEPAWASLCSACPAVPQCPLTCLPFVYGLDRYQQCPFCISAGQAL